MLKAIKETPQRIMDAWLDPVRRRHSLSRIIESYVPAYIVLLIILGNNWAFLWAGLITLGEFLFYEWLLEPLGFAGFYWERGPRDGETFTRW